MDEQIKDIVAVITESGVQTRRERAAFVAKLRDEMGLTFEQIGTQLNVGKVRAAQLYQLNKLFNRRPPAFANLSTRAWHFLENVASYNKFPEGWEESPDMTAKLLNTLAQMTVRECLKFRSCGQQTLAEIEQFMKSRNMSLDRGLGEAMEEDDTPKAPNPEEAMKQIGDYLVSIGGKPNEFKWFYPAETYKGGYAEGAQFVLVVYGVLNDAFEGDFGWSIPEKVAELAGQNGFHKEMAKPGVAAFYLDDGPSYAVDPQPPTQHQEAPTPNLADIQF